MTSRTTGPKLTPVVPTKELPSPVKRIRRKPLLKPLEEEKPEKSIAEIPAKVFTLIKYLPSILAENFSVVTGILTLTVVNALIALYLISFATIMLIKKFVASRRKHTRQD